MTWTDYFDKIFVINLPERADRRALVDAEMKKYDIPYELWPAIKHESGVEGIRLTTIELLEHCIVKDYERILVFEDDVEFMADPRTLMPKIVSQLPFHYWDMIYLGPNTHQIFTNFATPNLLPLYNGYGLHAVAYSKTGIRSMHEHCKPGLRELKDNKFSIIPIDVVAANYIQTNNHCFATFPLLCTQRNGYSDIENKEVDQSYIVERFNNNIKHLL